MITVTIDGKKGKTYIYGITDQYGNVVYVGKSNKPIQRFRQHKAWARNDKFVIQFKLWWLRDILKYGKPLMIILKEVDDTDWERWEQYYISFYKSKGNTLFNISDGGNAMSDKAKIKLEHANEIRKIPILQYSLNGDFIREWEYISLASRELGIIKQDLVRCLKGGRPSSGGFLWVYKSLLMDYPLKIDAHAKRKKISRK